VLENDGMFIVPSPANDPPVSATASLFASSVVQVSVVVGHSAETVNVLLVALQASEVFLAFTVKLAWAQVYSVANVSV